jgi:hypothetical protein
MRSFLGAVVVLVVWLIAVLAAGAWVSDYTHQFPFAGP